MKKVVKTGKYIYKTTCNVCECVFVYDEKEIEKEEYTIYDGSHGIKKFVTCPCCGENVVHAEYNKIEHQNIKPRNGVIELANKFAKDGNCPCGYYEFTDEVARFCDQEECNALCDPTECWLRVFEQIEKEK